jgi:hypothetical protein
MQGTSWPLAQSIFVSRTMPSSLISRRGLAASSMSSSGTRSIRAGSSPWAGVLTSNSTGDGSSVNVDFDMQGPFL